MANTCIVGIRIVTGNEDEGKRIFDLLTTAKENAEKKHEGIFIGCERRYLFDSEIYRDRDTLQIGGWVRWSFTDDEVKEFIAWLKTKAEIKTLHIDYDECGCLLFGEYNYADGRLTNHYLPEGDFPDDDDSDDFNITLESALKRYGITEEIPMP